MYRVSNIQLLLKILRVPGTEVPNATNAMALTESLRQMKQPNCAATSPMTAVQIPIMTIERTKQGYPFARPVVSIHQEIDGKIMAQNYTIESRFVLANPSHIGREN